MSKLNYSNFINDFIEDTRQKNNGVLCIFTDIDGTLPLSNNFKHAVIRTKNTLQKQMMFIANTGRTPKDLKGMLERLNIPSQIFDEILGNNGATSKYMKMSISKDNVSDILHKFIELGGEEGDVRYVAEDDIYIHRDEASTTYYSNKPHIELDDIIQKANSVNINKLTLTGSKEVIDKLIEYIEKCGYKCNIHVGNTKFRTRDKSKSRRRVDITSNECSKGIITKKVLRDLNLESFMVMGNDENDITMFKAAIEKKGYIVLVKHEEIEITKKIVKELKAYTTSIGKDWNEVKITFIEENEMNNFLEFMASRAKMKGQGNFLENLKVTSKKLPTAIRTSTMATKLIGYEDVTR
ncbi:MAG: HAD hydrolase family protein [Clostridia bacterium]